MNKKGISAIVATVLIILITVAAVTIVWAAIIPMITGQLDKGTLCLDAVSQVSIKDKGYTCWNSTANEVKIQVGHGPKDFVLAGIQVLISEAGDTNSVEITENLPGINSEKVITVPYTTTGTGPESISIAPIVQVGNTQETCDVSSTLAIKDC